MVSAINPYQNVIGAEKAEKNRTTEEERLMDACRGFESIFIEQMMKNMRNATFESDFIKKSTGEKIFTEMLDTEYSTLASSQSEGGLASLMFEQLKGLVSSDVSIGSLNAQAVNAYSAGEKFSRY